MRGACADGDAIISLRLARARLGPLAETYSLRLLRPAPLAKATQPSRSIIAEFPRQPKYETSHRQNRNFPE